MVAVGVKKVLDGLRIHRIVRVHEDLELLVSKWSAESHTFITITVSLDQLLRIFEPYGPAFRETNLMGVKFEEEDEDNLQQLSTTIGHSKAKSYSKCKYAS